MINLIRYHIKIYSKSNKFIAPVLLWVIFLYANYTVKPASVVPCLSSSAGMLYLIMIWMGFGYMELEDNISSQLVILKVRSATKYNISKILFLILSAIGMSLLGIIVPLTQHMINSYSLFTRNLIIEDLIYGFILLYVFAFLGVMLGSLFHPRIVSDRKRCFGNSIFNRSSWIYQRRNNGRLSSI